MAYEKKCNKIEILGLLPSQKIITAPVGRISKTKRANAKSALKKDDMKNRGMNDEKKHGQISG